MSQKKNQEISNDPDIEMEEEHNELSDEEVEESKDLKLKKIQKELKQCISERTELQDNLQRARADYLNAKRRWEADRIEDRDRVLRGYIESLLPVCDSFRQAMGDVEVWQSVDQTWRVGVENIYKQLQSVLKSHNIVLLEPKGEHFNPEVHEALSSTPVEDESHHDVVLEVVQPGYAQRRADNTLSVIRPARVIVGHHS